MFSIDHSPFSIKITPKEKILSARKATKNEIFKYMAGKLCHILDSSLKKKEEKNSNKNTSTFIKTPFTGDKENGVTVTREFAINPNGGNKLKVSYGSMKTDYASISRSLDSYREKSETNYKIILITIYNYLNLLSDKSIISDKTFNDFIQNNHRFKDLDKLETNFRKELNCFSAMLMVAEPFRFKDQGRQSRGLIRRLYQNLGSKITDSALTMKNATKLNKYIRNEEDENTKAKIQGITTGQITNYKTALDNDNIYMSEDEYKTYRRSKRIQERREKERKEKKEKMSFSYSPEESSETGDSDFDNVRSDEDDAEGQTSQKLSNSKYSWILHQKELRKEEKEVKEEQGPMIITNNYGSKINSSPSPSTSSDTTDDKMSEENTPKDEDGHEENSEIEEKAESYRENKQTNMEEGKGTHMADIQKQKQEKKPMKTEKKKCKKLKTATERKEKKTKTVTPMSEEPFDDGYDADSESD